MTNNPLANYLNIYRTALKTSYRLAYSVYRLMENMKDWNRFGLLQGKIVNIHTTQTLELGNKQNITERKLSWTWTVQFFLAGKQHPYTYNEHICMLWDGWIDGWMHVLNYMEENLKQKKSSDMSTNANNWEWEQKKILLIQWLATESMLSTERLITERKIDSDKIPWGSQGTSRFFSVRLFCRCPSVCLPVSVYVCFYMPTNMLLLVYARCIVHIQRTYSLVQALSDYATPDLFVTITFTPWLRMTLMGDMGFHNHVLFLSLVTRFVQHFHYSISEAGEKAHDFPFSIFATA